MAEIRSCKTDDKLMNEAGERAKDEEPTISIHNAVDDEPTENDYSVQSSISKSAMSSTGPPCLISSPSPRWPRTRRCSRRRRIWTGPFRCAVELKPEADSYPIGTEHCRSA